MATKRQLVGWLDEALSASGGRGRIADLCKHVWKNHEQELRASGDLFYTWQYDICVFLGKSNTDSPLNRTPIPLQIEHSFRAKPNTDSPLNRTAIPEQIERCAG
jgi:hypothetical protein